MTHLEKVRSLPCCVCLYLGLGRSPSVAHHLESVRDELSDYASVAICDRHHKELHALSRRGFENKYKISPIDLLAMTVRLLMKEHIHEF